MPLAMSMDATLLDVDFAFYPSMGPNR